MVLLSPTVLALAYSFLALAVVAGALAASVVTHAIVTNRSIRRAQRQSVRTYYGGLLLSH